MADTAIFDVDGTLVDTNYQPTLAWFRALAATASPGRSRAEPTVLGRTWTLSSQSHV